MPGRKSRKSKKGGRIRRRMGHRRSRRVARRGKASSIRLKGPTAFPDRVYIKLKYADMYTATITSGIQATQVMRGNSLFDPDRTGGGHQPYGYDQWAAMYGSYRVHASKITVRAMASGTFTTPGGYETWIDLYPAHNYTTPPSISNAGELPYAQFRMFPIYNAANKENWITSYMSTAKIWGVDKAAARSEDDFSALTGQNPANEWDWILTAGVVDQTTSSQMKVYIQVVYYAEFYDRLQPNQS